MQCPRCHSRTLILQKNKRVCKVPECFYQDQHPISFDNDVRHYEGQKGGENRFSTLYNAALDHGGITVDKQANYDKQLKKGQRHIRDICMVLKLSQKIQATAQARFITILGIRMRGKIQRQEKAQKNKNEKDKSDNEGVEVQSKQISIKQLACYSVYSACFQNQNFFEDNNLMKWLKISKKKWDGLLRTLNQQYKNKIDFIPIQKTWHFVVKVCRKRKIQPAEQKAMIKLCQTIAQRGIQDGSQRKTVAACVFWKICQYSTKYRNVHTLTDICKKHEQIDASKQDPQKYFDTTPETIKKFFSDKMQRDFEEQYLPNWEGRIPLNFYKDK